MTSLFSQPRGQVSQLQVVDFQKCSDYGFRTNSKNYNALLKSLLTR